MTQGDVRGLFMYAIVVLCVEEAELLYADWE